MWIKNMCNVITWPWPRYLLRLPLMIRLGICLICLPLGITIYLLALPVLPMGCTFIIPMGLASWIFSKRGACVCFFGYAIGLPIYQTILVKSIWWPHTMTIAFIYTSMILFFEGSLVVSLRTLWETEETARLKAEQGEQQAAIAYEQQRQLNQIKNHFIINVNHELRTPLTAASGYLEMLNLLLEEGGTLDRATHGVYLKKALSYYADLQAVVNSSLDALEIGSKEEMLKFEKISVAIVVQETLKHFPAFQQHIHQIRLDIPTDMTIWGSVECLRHILHNLFSNAFKYSPSNAPVIVRARHCAETPSQICICIQDAGPGIPPEEIPLLFRQFVRLQRDLGGTVRGSGLGLYISKRLVEAMGGEIWVESKGVAGLGSLFYFTLPSAS